MPIENTHFSSDFESALPELVKQARLSGADTIIEIQEQSAGDLEMRSYYVTAIGIEYKSVNNRIDSEQPSLEARFTEVLISYT